MNFTDESFLLLFLPITLAVSYSLHGSDTSGLRQSWLTIASIVFYAISGLWNLALMFASVGFNFGVGAWLAGRQRHHDRLIFWAAVGINLMPLMFFKALPLWRQGGSNFLAGGNILIPLSLSFLTFQQIAFLLECYRRRYRPILRHYLFFILFFPQRIMGPILSYPVLERQLRRGRLGSVGTTDLSVGFAIFVFGLSKKLLIADKLAVPVDRIYAATALGTTPSLGEAWFALLGFQLQLFLDFSAYSEMAIGLARMFGIAFPINFDHPYHAVNRFDLWRRWHITFVMFMRQHVFTPLVRRWRVPAWAALAMTAFLSGLWHGFGLTFLLWSTMQTALLLALHFRAKRNGLPSGKRLVWAVASTFLVTCLLGTMFRSPDVATAGRIYASLAKGDVVHHGAVTTTALLVLLLAAAMVWLIPDAQRLFSRYWTALDPRDPARGGGKRADGVDAPVRFRLDFAWGAACGLMLLLALMQTGDGTRFIYAQF